MSTRKRSLATMVVIAFVLMTSAAYAGPAEVTSGEFDTFAAGGDQGYQIDGKAQMVRTADGKTIVVVNVSGLTPGATYGSHVHAQACGNGDAGSHYRFAEPVPGGALDGHEIWPGPFTANASGKAAGMTVVQATAEASAQSVVIHAPGGAKIGCADLS
jgi:hypothetical protein